MSFLAKSLPMSRENGVAPKRKPTSVQKSISNMQISFGEGLLVVRTHLDREVAVQILTDL
jgi:hypothetical protein